MSKWKKLWEQTKEASADAASRAASSAEKVKSYVDANKDDWIEKGSKSRDRSKEVASEAAQRIKGYVEENKDSWKEDAANYTKQAKETASGFIEEGSRKTQEQAKGLYVQARYSQAKLKDLEQRVESQGAMYRELLRNKPAMDALFLGGESMAILLVAESIPSDIESAYEGAFPDMSQKISFQEKLRSLDDENEIAGLLSAVKGKLFENRYVDYLNGGVLPEGYSAALAEGATQAGWDIAITGPHDEVVQLLQAKATDSVSYVKSALEQYPSIDVVTTDEVYSHLIMAGVSDNISSGGISNLDLSQQVEMAASSVDYDFDFAPPILTLAFIAFTSYRDTSLTMYEKAKSAGDRSAKTYFSYLIGGSLAAITNTWWLGVLGSVSSRYMSDEGLRKVKLVESLKSAIESNQKIINRLKVAPNVA